MLGWLLHANVLAFSLASLPSNTEGGVGEGDGYGGSGGGDGDSGGDSDEGNDADVIRKGGNDADNSSDGGDGGDDYSGGVTVVVTVVCVFVY